MTRRVAGARTDDPAVAAGAGGSGHPNLTGLQVAAAIRDLAPTVPVLLLTGSADSAAVTKARQLGLTILHKPILIPTLRAAIEAALRAE